MTKNRIVGLAQIGLGAWSSAIADAVGRSGNAKLVTCYTRTTEKRKAFSEKYGCDHENSYEDVLKRTDVGGVLLTSPNAVHAEQAILAAQNGKHVFVDKPLANTMEQGKAIVDACKKSGVILMVGHHMRRFSGFRKMKELIDAGTIGDPIQVEANFSHNMGLTLKPGDFRWRGDDSGCPAGALMTMGIHHADTLNYLFGPIKSVFSFFNKLYVTADVEDVTTTIFQFESGILGYLGSNYASPKALWMYVYGTRANLLCTVTLPELPFAEYLLHLPFVDRDTQLQIFEKGKTGSKNVPLSEGDPILDEMDDFADCIRSGRQPETDGKGGLAALALIRATIESARTGKQAEIEK
ncbi:MAG: Gfo/Idh/MocA family oxidoreductase [Deltaproteobacteria bacterium]|nr:Gfo/Idh/MocA family oxidoreductase [Deltaproteobacteria bacterium]